MERGEGCEVEEVRWKGERVEDESKKKSVEWKFEEC